MCPSTSILPFASILPVTVISPVTSIPAAAFKLPAISTSPLELIVNLLAPLVISLIPKIPPTFLRAKSGLASESINWITGWVFVIVKLPFAFT